jgi:hypothetical protein
MSALIPQSHVWRSTRAWQIFVVAELTMQTGGLAGSVYRRFFAAIVE